MKKVLLVIVMSFLFAGLSFAQNETPEKEPREDEPTKAMINVKLAQELANYGYENKSVISLISAAEIIVNNPIEKLTPVKIEEGSKEQGAKKGQVIADIQNVGKMMEDAAVMAGDDETLLALIEDVKSAPKSRGVVGGSKIGYYRVSANDYNVFWVTFREGELAEVVVIGDGDTDLDLYIYDENDNFITKDTDNTDACYVSWNPKWTGEFKIKVKNLGTVYNEYVIATN